MLQEMLVSLFKAAGFTCNGYKVHERQIENRQQQVVMHRRWVQAIFTYKPRAVDLPQTRVPLPAVGPPQAGGPPLQAQAPAQPEATSETNEEDQLLKANTAAAPLADHHPTSQKSSSTSQGRTTSGSQAPPSDQQAAATNHQPAWQQQPAASQPQQPWSSDATSPASASRVPQDGCVAQPVGKQQGANHQQGSAGATALTSSHGASVPGLEAQQEGSVAAPTCSVATQGQEWQEGGINPEQEPLTGCLFADSTLEEVKLRSCLAVHLLVQCMALDELAHLQDVAVLVQTTPWLAILQGYVWDRLLCICPCNPAADAQHCRPRCLPIAGLCVCQLHGMHVEALPTCKRPSVMQQCICSFFE